MITVAARRPFRSKAAQVQLGDGLSRPRLHSVGEIGDRLVERALDEAREGAVQRVVMRAQVLQHLGPVQSGVRVSRPGIDGVAARRQPELRDGLAEGAVRVPGMVPSSTRAAGRARSIRNITKGRCSCHERTEESRRGGLRHTGWSSGLSAASTSLSPTRGPLRCGPVDGSLTARGRGLLIVGSATLRSPNPISGAVVNHGGRTQLARFTLPPTAPAA